MSDYLSCVEIEPATPAVATVIWLHGLGADGNDFVPVVPELQLPESLPLRFVFPHAPVRPVTINGGMPMRAWYDILSMGDSREVNEAQLNRSKEQVDALIDREQQRGIAADRILLIGFSQGGAVAYQSALRSPHPLAGLATLSTYRIKAALPENQALAHNRSLPVFTAHGEWDAVVPRNLGRQGFESLQAEGLEPAWHSYPMGHEVCLAEIRDLGDWMQRILLR